MFVVESDNAILYAVLIYFPDIIITKYKETLESFGQKYIEWYRIGLNMEQNLKNVALYHAVDVQTVIFWRNMAKQLVQLNRDERYRLTPAHEIVPYAISLWNKVKGGHDVVSRQLKNVKVNFRWFKPRAFIIMRQIMTQLLNVHLVHRIWIYGTKFINIGMNKKTLTYQWLKQRLNGKRSFNEPLLDMFKSWDFQSLNFADFSIQADRTIRKL